MKHLDDYGDDRTLAWCVHCGGDPDTDDHVPSRVLLDEPYPEQLPVIRICGNCNNRFSVDEEYLACLVECVRTGAGRPDDVERGKIRRILTAKPALAARLWNARRVSSGGVWWEVETDRVSTVVLKLARGHALYEMHEAMQDEPEVVAFRPLVSMSHEDRLVFEDVPRPSIWPEVGSRAMQRLALSFQDEGDSWVPVQEGRYRYSVSWDSGVEVRMVISEYLACRVAWP